MDDVRDEVLAFFNEWATLSSMREAFARRFTPDTVWENVGLARTVGPEEAAGFGKTFFGDSAVARVEVVVHHIAVAGNHALTERTDIFYDAAGDEILKVRVMGIMEMAGAKIVAWRDYFDTRLFPK